MLRTVLLVSSVCGLVTSSGVGVAHVAPIAAAGPAPAPVVTASSSQYFQRTFNRLVVPPVVAPVAPAVPPPLAPLPVAPAPTVFVEPTRSVPVTVNSHPPQEVQPNVAIAVATAHAAAPVATILLPPYPFGFPPTFGFIPSEQPINVPDENTKEPTTQRTTQTEATTTPEPEATTPIDTSSSDNSFVQALPSNENGNFNTYGPPPQPQPGSQFRPQQLNPQLQPQQPNQQFQPQRPNTQFQPQRPNTQFQPQQPNLQFQPQQPNLQFQPQQPNQQFQPQRPNPQFQPQQPNPQFQPQYPPYPPKQQPRPQFEPQARPQQPRPQRPWPQQKGRPQKLKTSVEVVPVPLAYITPPPLKNTHEQVKVVKHIYTFVPASRPKIILKPIKVRPVKIVKHKIIKVRPQNLRAIDRDIEVTTFNPFPRPNTKPPRV